MLAIIKDLIHFKPKIQNNILLYTLYFSDDLFFLII